MIPKSTYFTRLLKEPIEQQFQQFKDDFNLNECEKDFAIILFECDGHVTTIVADLRKGDKPLSDRLYLFDTSLEHANNIMSPHLDNLNDYFGGLIKEENVFYKDYRIQAIGNCAWLSAAFVEECSQLKTFEEVEQKINSGELLVKTINRTSKLMQENLGPLLTFNDEDRSITLNENISKSKAVNIERLSKLLDKKIKINEGDIVTQDDYSKKPTEIKVVDPRYGYETDVLVYPKIEVKLIKNLYKKLIIKKYKIK